MDDAGSHNRRMIRREFNFAIALAVSLALHALLFAVTAPVWRGWLGRGHAPPIVQPQEITVALQPPDSPPDMGDANGHGIGSNASEGERLLSAQEAEENQALLDRQPRGPQRLVPTITDANQPPGEEGRGGQQGGGAAGVQVSAIPPTAPPAIQPPAESIAPPTPPTSAIQVTEPQDPAVNPTIVAVAQPTVELPEAVDRPRADVKPEQNSANQVAVTKSSRPQTGDGRAPGIDLRPASPAQQSDSESDPFAQIGSAVFHDGKLEIRKGRKVKTTRPHVLLSGQVDLISLGGATVVLKISVDATGKVTSVDVIRSSGSNDIDQPTRIAVYDWWFEPTRDKSGRPVADTFPFLIRYE